ncbi:MAG: hypothetical protein ACN6QT_18045 [Burkholderia contaminans]|uniref:Uncharacterized protein n=1 Tax=Burkholderia contaminans TaxID=488447 RepID=A0AAP4R562_9BURK|nr:MULTISPECIES: hypothetical protein [Burkholderia]MDN7566124.1 hypothetical protein [Burkholderia contaminans]MDN8020824.1 hypothetical protein [Burkholderia contaminans]UXZ72138.1 hypothetical protein NUJ29_37410 [Burkholderia contaminans]UXZ79605.1 hypothetical protein NUJ30_35865 [Burkholderia contaminans]
MHDSADAKHSLAHELPISAPVGHLECEALSLPVVTRHKDSA